MAVKSLWQPPLVPEEPKKAQWENIRWRLDTSGPEASTPNHATTYRGRLVHALRAEGKPIE
jgi:hypothetical protein